MHNPYESLLQNSADLKNIIQFLIQSLREVGGGGWSVSKKNFPALRA